MSINYNILCVTKRSKDDSWADFHLPADADSATMEGKAVHYNGKQYPIRYSRPGLSGSAVVLGLADGDAILELYTDTPVEGSNATPESLRKSAEYMMNAEVGRSIRRP